MRVACIRNRIVVNVIEVEDINQLPDWFVVGFDDDGNPIRKADCELFVKTKVGSLTDYYKPGVGFYRQNDTDPLVIELVERASDVQEL